MSSQRFNKNLIKSLLVLSTLCIPSFIQNAQIQIFFEPLVVSFPAESPAYAAFEDSRFESEDDYSFDELYDPSEDVELLQAKLPPKKVFKQIKETSKLLASLEKESKTIKFGAMEISSAQLFAQMQNEKIVKPTRLVAVEPTYIDEVHPTLKALGETQIPPKPTNIDIAQLDEDKLSNEELVAQMLGAPEKSLQERAIELWNKNLASEGAPQTKILQKPSHIFVSAGGKSSKTPVTRASYINPEKTISFFKALREKYPHVQSIRYVR